MSKSSYILVKWVHENKFSVLRRDKICVLKLRNTPDSGLLKKTTDVLWSKKPYSATIIELGEKDELKQKLKFYENPQKKRKESLQEPSSTQLQVAAVLTAMVDEETEQRDELALDVEATSSLPQEETVEYWKEKYSREIDRAAKYKNKVKSLRAKLKSREPNDEEVYIAPGVKMDRAELDTIQTVSSSPSIFARNLMRAVFKDQNELVGKSLFGRKCNANDGIPKEPINAVKRDAIILATCKQYGSVSGGTSGRICSSFLSPIHRTMGDYIREVSRKNKQEQPQMDASL